MSYIDDIKNKNIIIEKNNSKSMKGLEAIQEYKRVICPNCQYKDKENCDVVCFSNIIEKELKALEIIKRFSYYDLSFLDYLLFEDKITQEEYDLLKEVLL